MSESACPEETSVVIEFKAGDHTRTRGDMCFSARVSHPIVSTGARMVLRISFTAS